MKLLPAARHRRMPWKNGGGETVEIAVFPEGAGLDDFDWRVSMARVGSDGPFSGFPGVDRTLSLLDGNGIVLGIAGRTPFELTARHEPVSFPADVPTSARLVAGPITDLNVMSRRGRFGHTVRFVDVGRHAGIETTAAHALILAVAGSVTVAAGAETGALAVHDCLLLDEPAVVSVSGSGPAIVAVVEFRHI